MTWAEFTATLSDRNHRQVLVALGAGLQEARHASEVVTNGGDVDDVREHVLAALEWLEQARAILGPVERE